VAWLKSPADDVSFALHLYEAQSALGDKCAQGTDANAEQRTVLRISSNDVATLRVRRRNDDHSFEFCGLPEDAKHSALTLQNACRG